MRMPLDEFVKTDGNREAFERIVSITEDHDKPVKLFLDDFEGFFSDKEIGPMMCKLLLGERAAHRLDTVITSTKPLSEYDLSDLGGMLDDFEEVTMEALDDAGLEEYVRGLAEDYYEEGKSPRLSPEAVAYIAHDLGQTPTMMRKATHFLITQYEGEPGEELSRAFVEQALA